ncbi:MAG TPA: hypothetical protein VKG63_14500 [Steroidobacteraceae bacterium]|nr:hypothetical protein [Steroidobacteraceae bacterium]
MRAALGAQIQGRALENARPHKRPYYFAAAGLPLAAAHASFVIDVQPVPLQLFMPLQLFFADLHSDIPLHEFAPTQ